MQNRPYIEFKKQRELGEILSDTFNFVRLEFKSFFGTFIKIVGPYLLVLVLFIGGYFYYLNSLVSYINIESEFAAFDAITMLFLFLGLFVSSICFLITSKASVLFYIKSYIENKGSVEFQEVRKSVYKNFWSFLGLMLLIWLASIFAIALCFFPYIYIWPIMTLTYCVMVFEEQTIMDSFQYPFKLIKDNWWITFATLLIVGIIVGILGGVLQVPAFLYSIIRSAAIVIEADAETMPQLYDPIQIILSIFGYLFQYLCTAMIVVSTAFIFFNLNEKKNFTGTMERIQNLGKEDNN